VRIERLPDSAAVAARGAALFAACAARAIEERGQFVVALSGGSTPRALHESLTSDEWRPRLDWPYVEFCWGDERPVPPDDPQSNFGMARDTLLQPLGIADERIHRMRGEAADLAGAAAEYAGELTRLTAAPAQQPPVLDVILLGMGSDAHTASLFPHTDALHVRDRWVVANRVPALDTTRLTITFPVIHAARTVIVLVSGAGKAQALRAVMTGPPDPDRLPAQRLADAGGTVIWLVDEPAHGALA
jgi:6-phosphogluconolactonase